MKVKVKGKSLSRVLLLATPWTAAYQAPPSMGFSKQEYWSGVQFIDKTEIDSGTENKLLVARGEKGCKDRQNR